MASDIFLDLQWRLAGLQNEARGMMPSIVNKRGDNQPPLVTVFGGGITGLTVAQELIERGFGVQIVEPAESPIEEYGSDVGGMAANQFSRVQGDLGDILSLKPVLADGTSVPPLARVEDWLLKVRGVRMRPVLRRIALTESIVFDKANPTGWLYDVDAHGVTNEAKLHRVLDKLYGAFGEYYADYRERMELAEVTNKTINPNYLSDDDLPVVYWREILAVRVIGFTFKKQPKREGGEEADKVINALRALDRARPSADKPMHFKLERHLVAVGRGETSSGNPFAQRQRFDGQRRDGVEFEVIEQIMPGEHGFRFFPAFYRNLFDTMKRVPAFDRFGVETNETAHSHLVPTADPSVSVKDEPAQEINHRVVKSLSDLERLSGFMFQSVGFTERDVLRLQVRLFRYLTSCKRRRIEQCETETFWKYIGGEEKENPGYSGDAARFIQHAPRALAAMAATEVDARTQANILLQMLIQQPFEAPAQDFTLDGCTSQAFLDVWKTYLDAQGVRFFTGRLERIALGKGWVQNKDTTWSKINEFVPVVAGPPGWRLPRPEVPGQQYMNVEPHAPNVVPDANFDADVPDFSKGAVPTNYYHDFFVLAVSLDEASRLVQDAWKQVKLANPGESKEEEEKRRARFAGPFLQLVDFDLAADRRLKDPDEPLKGIAEPERHADTGAVPGAYTGKGTWPSRDISGIQYFFPNRYRFGNGHVYLADSAWGLTSISQLAYARDRTSPVGRFLGQVSVDIGDWYAPWEQDPRGPLAASAWRSRKTEIATTTWEQMKSGLDKDYREVMLPPQHYHLDWGIRFEEIERGGFSGNILAAVTHGELIVEYFSQGSMPVTRVYSGEPYENKSGLDAIAARINIEDYSPGNEFKHGLFAFVTGLAKCPQALMFAPYVQATKFKIWISDLSESPYAIAIRIAKDEFKGPFVSTKSGEVSSPEKLAIDLKGKIDAGVSGVRVSVDGPIMVIESEDAIQIAVANFDKAITIESAGVPDPGSPGNLISVDFMTVNATRHGLESDTRWNARVTTNTPRKGEGKDKVNPYASATLKLEGQEFTLTFGDRNQSITAREEWPYKILDAESVAGRLAENISLNVFSDKYGKNIVGDARVFAFHDPSARVTSLAGQHLVLSPMVEARQVILHLKKGSKQPFAIGIFADRNNPKTPEIHCVPARKTQQNQAEEQIHGLINSINSGRVAHAEGYGPGGILVTVKGKYDVMFSVANADDCIHIERAIQSDGTPSKMRALELRVRRSSNVLPLQILRETHAGTADTKRVSVAGACVVKIPTVVPGRTYTVRANLAGIAPTTATEMADAKTTAEEVAKSLANQLSQAKHLNVVYVPNNEARIGIWPKIEAAAATVMVGSAADEKFKHAAEIAVVFMNVATGQTLGASTKVLKDASAESAAKLLFDELGKSPISADVSVELVDRHKLNITSIAPSASQPVPVMRFSAGESPVGDTPYIRISTIPVELALTNVTLLNPQDRTPVRNATPFLINLPGQWQLRPGLNLNSASRGGRVEHPETGEMSYTHSDPLLRRWVPAGTWMATDTRMTTMEAANESAKHAVSGMLHMIMTPHMGGGAGEVAFGAQGKLLGDFPVTYRPEEYEFRDLDNLRKVDERLAAEGKPHFIDILRLTEVIDKLPATGIASNNHIDSYRALLRGVNETLLDNKQILGKQFVGMLMQSFMSKVEDYLKRHFSASP